MDRSKSDIIFHRSLLAEIHILTVAVVLTLFGVWLTYKLDWSVQYLSIMGYSFPVPLFLLFALVSWLYFLNRLYNVRYEIATDHVRIVKGIMSPTKKDYVIEYHNIRDLEVDRHLMGRIFNFGDLLINSSTSDNSKFILSDISNPSYYRNEIMTRLNTYLKNMQRNPADPAIHQ